MHRLQILSDAGHSHGFSSFFKGLSRSCSPKFCHEVREFEETLTREIEALKPPFGEALLSLQWLPSALTLALAKHWQAVQLIPPFQFPLSVCDHKWITDYMDQTTRVMDMCNILSVEVSVVQQANLLISHAIHALGEIRSNGLIAGKAAGAQRSLREWLDSHQVKAESLKPLVLLQQMSKGLAPPKEKDIAKGKWFLFALYGANVMVVFVLYALALFFLPSKGELLCISIDIPQQFLWSSSFLNLLCLAKEEGSKATAISSSFPVCMGELCDLKSHVVSLLLNLEQIDCSSSPPTEDDLKKLVQLVESLGLLLACLSGKLDLVWQKLDEMFQTIVASRSALLDRLGHFGATDSL